MAIILYFTLTPYSPLGAEKMHSGAGTLRTASANFFIRTDSIELYLGRVLLWGELSCNRFSDIHTPTIKKFFPKIYRDSSTCCRLWNKKNGNSNSFKSVCIALSMAITATFNVYHNSSLVLQINGTDDALKRGI